MLDQQIRARGIRDQRVLAAMDAVPRELFLPAHLQHLAYEDRAVEIGHSQTISQPYMVAFMTEKLEIEESHKVLEVGTGSGYQTAILSKLSKWVVSLERLPELAQLAADHLRGLGTAGITFLTGDGTLGAPNLAPFDRILVTAAAPRVPQPLVDQLADAGRLVIPIGGKRSQTVTVVRRSGSRTVETPLLPCRFVRLIGRAGWSES